MSRSIIIGGRLTISSSTGGTASFRCASPVAVIISQPGHQQIARSERHSRTRRCAARFSNCFEPANFSARPTTVPLFWVPHFPSAGLPTAQGQCPLSPIFLFYRPAAVNCVHLFAFPRSIPSPSRAAAASFSAQWPEFTCPLVVFFPIIALWQVGRLLACAGDKDGKKLDTRGLARFEG